MYKRFTEKRKGKNVIPLLNSVCGVDLPKWTISVESDIRRYLSGDAVDKFAELEDKIENGTLIEKPKYKLHQKVYILMCGNAIKGTIDGYDVYKKKYLVFIENEHDFGRLGFGNEWFSECELFLTKAEAEKKLYGSEK